MKPVLITTEYRGVFFGYVEDESTLPEKVVLKNARNCVYWDSQVKGVLGLATTGPNEKCRIGNKVPQITLWKVTSITECTPEAVEEWEKGPWS